MSSLTRDQILAVVLKNLKDNLEDLDDKSIDPAKSMKDMGANSLDIVEVVSSSMRELKIRVPRAELADVENVNQLVDLFFKVHQEQAANPAATSAN